MFNSYCKLKSGELLKSNGRKIYLKINIIEVNSVEQQTRHCSSHLLPLLGCLEPVPVFLPFWHLANAYARVMGRSRCCFKYLRYYHPVVRHRWSCWQLASALHTCVHYEPIDDIVCFIVIISSITIKQRYSSKCYILSFKYNFPMAK